MEPNCNSDDDAPTTTATEATTATATAPALNKKKQKLVKTWQPEQVTARIAEIEASLGNEEMSKSRRRLLYSKIARLRKALNGECVIGRQKERKEVKRKKIDKRQKIDKRRDTKPSLSRWGKSCLCCRKSSHTMAECRKNPAVKEKQETEGANGQQKSSRVKLKSFCFNCGKSEHTIWNCPAPKQEDGSLPFATCFLCGQSGHLVAKCPQNTTGVYPEGGACHVCNSLYHLVKDCPSRINNDTSADGRQNRRSQQNHKQKQREKSNKSNNDDDNDAYWT